MDPNKNNKNDKYSNDYFKIQVLIIQALYLYLKRKKNATILNLYNNLNLMKHVTCAPQNRDEHLKKKKKFLDIFKLVNRLWYI